MKKNTSLLNVVAVGVMLCLSACGSGSSSSTPAAITPTTPSTPTSTGSSVGAINAISSTNPTDPTTTYGASLKAAAIAAHNSVILLGVLGDLQNAWGDASSADCNSGTIGVSTASDTGFAQTSPGPISASQTLSNCGAQVYSLLAFTGSLNVDGTVLTMTTANATQSWVNPITATNPFGASGNLITLAPGSLAMSGSGLNIGGTGRGAPTWTFSNTSSNPTLTFQTGPASIYKISNLNGSSATSTCPSSGTCPVTFNSTVSSGLLANVGIDGITYAVSIITPITAPSIIPSSANNGAPPTGGSIGVSYGNATCGTLTITFLSSGAGVVMSCSTAPTVSQQVFFNSSDWNSAWTAAEQ